MSDQTRRYMVRKNRYAWIMLLAILAGTACGALQHSTESEALESDETAGENGGAGETDTLESMETSITERSEDAETALEEEENTFELGRLEENTYDDPEDIGDYPWVYSSNVDITFDYEYLGEESVPPYVDNEIFAVIRAAYEEVDFNGEFETGDPEDYDDYRWKFWELLQGRGIIWDQETGKELTILEFLEESFYLDEYDPTKQPYTYYFFDMDGDGYPELGIWETQSLYFLRYNQEIDRFSVWYNEMGGWYYPLGTRKGICAPNGKWCYYILLDKNAETECETYFFHESYTRKEDLYMVMLPIYADKEREVEVTQEMKAQGAYVRSDRQWFFRVTEEQYDELAGPYFEAYWKGHHERKDVQYSYDELFGDFIQGEGNDYSEKSIKMDKHDAADFGVCGF